MATPEPKKAGRPKGAKSAVNAELEQRLEALPGDDLTAKLSTVAEDAEAPVPVRLKALAYLFGSLAGQIATSPPRATK